MSLSSSAFVMATSVMLLILLTSNVTASSLQYGNLLENIGVKAECPPNIVRVKQDKPGNVMPSGTPIYLAQVFNDCNCKVANVHLYCGAFKSEKPISPDWFRVVGPNDCLVRNGQPLEAGNIFLFQYASPQMFPLSVKSYHCL